MAYYFSRDMLMIYDYQNQGSVSALLHENTVENKPDWETRLRIAKGAARGIAHTHTRHRGRLVHGNIKASNIFLNSEKYGCVSDFGLGSAEVAPVVMCATGYRAPEVTIAGKVSQASDVYSFGVLLLELLTGRSPMNGIGVKKVDLVKWVLSLLGEDRRLEVFESLALSFPNEVEKMVKMLRVAMSCVADSPYHRPTMPDVLKMMEDL
ncbi:probable inactive receptor kinase At4g23740 [Olea europaea var. sylvestris]|uniref:probable inactive receptor kinase At4g23740 n=1 Tax=Olea europaea var. sylvestris TaxID=158386 RepID=UPI000C1D8204|nr:probable inactive receptor kinase At4g23740 [Olea europaea var. sylvestris]XP_022865595.1 probable inactive receptor kinase At4g23740 [Olea europaea var. sylvestris]